MKPLTVNIPETTTYEFTKNINITPYSDYFSESYKKQQYSKRRKLT